MPLGVLYGIGVGPGDPDLITVKGARILARCPHVFVPKAKHSADSVALAIARSHLSPDAAVHEVVFPMVTDPAELEQRWRESAKQVAEVLETGQDACFLTLGDALLYSTYIYLIRALRRVLPQARIITIPGVTAFSAAAALTEFPVGEGKMPVTIIPMADDLENVRQALMKRGTVVLMKIGRRLDAVLDLLEEAGAIDGGVFVSHAGMAEQRLETDLRKLRGTGPETGYLSLVLTSSPAEREG
jgi:precorrin-2/cobalt-factor-2 C20-methyltransferase